MSDIGFHPQFVAPFYSYFLGGNLATLSEQNEQDTIFITQFQATLPLYDSALLLEMLQDENWRPVKVAAWVIGIQKLQNFTPQLIQLLHQKPVYAEHLLAALLLLGSQEAAAGIQAYIYHIPFWLSENYTGLDVCQEVSLAWAFSALELWEKEYGVNLMSEAEKFASKNQFPSLAWQAVRRNSPLLPAEAPLWFYQSWQMAQNQAQALEPALQKAILYFRPIKKAG